jgi:pimeloyl-ACP methyl ester carboxylesterase
MHRFTHRGVGLAYIDVPPHQGDGPAVLLIHGFASNHSVNWIGPQWVKSLTHAGYRVIAIDNRGHGQSEKLYDPGQYHTSLMAGDAAALLDHLGIRSAGVVGYSMGARISAFLALHHPEKVAALALGGLGIRLVEGVGLPMGIADALEAPSLGVVTDPMGRMFRAFAEQTRSDLRALAACIRGTRQTLSPAECRQISAPTIVCVGINDPIAGDPHGLAALFPDGQAFDIAGRDHNLAVGDRTHREAVISFFNTRLK